MSIIEFNLLYIIFFEMKLIWSRFIFHHEEKMCEIYHEKDSEMKNVIKNIILNCLEKTCFNRYNENESSISLWREIKKTIIELHDNRELIKLFIKSYNCEQLCCKTIADDFDDREFHVHGEIYFSFVFGETS